MIAIILLLLMIGGIVLAVMKVLSKCHIKMKYISSEDGHLASEDGSRVDGEFDN